MEEKFRLLEYKRLLLRCLEGGGYTSEMGNEENWSDEEVFEKFKELVMELIKKNKNVFVSDEVKGFEVIQGLKNDNFSLRRRNQEPRDVKMNEEKIGSGDDHLNASGVNCKDFEQVERSKLNVFNLEFRNIPQYSSMNSVSKPKELSSRLKLTEKTEQIKNSTQTIKSVKFEYFGKRSKPFDNSRILINNISKTNSSASSPAKLKVSHGRSNSNII
jgi:hypothetical protein